MIYIGNFVHLTNQEEASEADRRHGEFSLIVEADTRDTAVGLFKERILQQRESSDFFGGDCSVYFVELLELDKLPVEGALMLNFKSIAGDPVMPFIACSVPTEEGDACRIFDWNNSEPEVDGAGKKLFLAFKK